MATAARRRDALGLAAGGTGTGTGTQPRPCRPSWSPPQVTHHWPPMALHPRDLLSPQQHPPVPVPWGPLSPGTSRPCTPGRGQPGGTEPAQTALALDTCHMPRSAGPGLRAQPAPPCPPRAAAPQPRMWMGCGAGAAAQPEPQGRGLESVPKPGVSAVFLAGRVVAGAGRACAGGGRGGAGRSFSLPVRAEAAAGPVVRHTWAHEPGGSAARVHRDCGHRSGDRHRHSPARRWHAAGTPGHAGSQASVSQHCAACPAVRPVTLPPHIPARGKRRRGRGAAKPTLSRRAPEEN